MWNLFNHMAVARKVIQENRKFDDFSELAKFFNIFKSPNEEE